MAEGRRRGSDPVSPQSDVFSDDHAVEHCDEPDSPVSISPHDSTTHSNNRRMSSIEARRQSSIQTLSRRSLPANVCRQDGDSRRPSHSRSVHERSDIARVNSQHYLTGMQDSKHLGHRREESEALFGAIPRAQSPYHGATGPSQPYGMYPQGTQSRTSSIATSINPRSSRRSAQAHSGPAQPYALYPQNAVPEDEGSPGQPQSIPIGFPGHGQGHTYQRRLGPEGEDAEDMIGPLGHTEPLPPYTRYANELPSRAGMGPPRDITPRPSSQQQHSQESIAEAPSDHSVNRELLNPPGPTLTHSTAAPPSEQRESSGHTKEKITEQGKRRVCGTRVPLWLLVVVVSVLVCAIIVGGVLGARARNHDPPFKKHHVPPSALAATTVFTTVTSTTLIDAISLTSTPSNLPPLPTGSYTLNLQNPSPASSDCLDDHPGQAAAWACSEDATLQVDVFAEPSSPWVRVKDRSRPGSAVRYGPQAPQLGENAALMLMADKDDGDKGPAYIFQRTFDKLVILREEELNDIDPSTKKRSWHGADQGGLNTPIAERTDDTGDSMVKATHRPWYCFWNATVLEGFLYLTKNINDGSNAKVMAKASSTDMDCEWSTIPSGQPAPSAAYPSSSQHRRDRVNPPGYSKVVKIKERRWFDASMPYCQQFQMLANGALGPLTYPGTQNLIKVVLDEDPPDHQKSGEKWKRTLQRSRHQEMKREDSGQGCQCQWVVE